MIADLFQPMHLFIILVVVLILFGPGKLPEIGSALGKGIRDFRKAQHAPGSDAMTDTDLPHGTA